MSVIGCWWYGEDVHIQAHRAFVAEVVGEQNVKKVWKAPGSMGIRVLCEASLEERAKYQKLFDQLKPGYFWLYEPKEGELKGRIKSGPLLMWMEGPGKLYFAVKQEEGYSLERFFPGNRIPSAAESVSKESLQKRVAHYAAANRAHAPLPEKERGEKWAAVWKARDEGRELTQRVRDGVERNKKLLVGANYGYLEAIKAADPSITVTLTPDKKPKIDDPKGALVLDEALYFADRLAAAQAKEAGLTSQNEMAEQRRLIEGLRAKYIEAFDKL